MSRHDRPYQSTLQSCYLGVAVMYLVPHDTQRRARQSLRYRAACPGARSAHAFTFAATTYGRYAFSSGNHAMVWNICFEHQDGTPHPHPHPPHTYGRDGPPHTPTPPPTPHAHTFCDAQRVCLIHALLLPTHIRCTTSHTICCQIVVRHTRYAFGAFYLPLRDDVLRTRPPCCLGPDAI